MRLSALGGASEIGANCFLLESGRSRFLLDAGTHPRKMGNDSLPDLSRSPDGDSSLTVRTFHNGHLLGSVGFLFEGREGRVVYSGDICLHERELQKGLVAPDGPVDVLIVEGTYGASPFYHADRYEDEVERF